MAKLFVTPASCPVGAAACRKLRDLGVRLETEEFEGAQLPSHLLGVSDSLVALFVPARHPKLRIAGRHRILKPHDVDDTSLRYLGVVLPAWAAGLKAHLDPKESQLVAFRSTAADDEEAFDLAIRTLVRETTGTWLPARKKVVVGVGAPPKVTGTSRHVSAHRASMGGIL